MKLDGYSTNFEAHVAWYDDKWDIYPENFAKFVATFELPEEIPMAVPSFVAPDVFSADPNIKIATWAYIMSQYFIIDPPPYEFEYRGEPLPEPKPDPEVDGDVVY